MRRACLPALTVTIVALSQPGALAQGSDDCATATPITGIGIFFYDNSTATTGLEGQNETLCLDGSNQTGIDFDLWWEWTPPTSGMARVNTCGQTTTDTKIAAWLGPGCPADGTALACDDDACPGQQSEIFFPVIAGQRYMLQMGNWPGANGGLSSFKISIGGSPGAGFCPCDPGSAFPTGVCGNSGAPGNGCANGSFPAGAHLAASGMPSVSNDTLTLIVGTAVPSQPGLFFQGDNAIQNGNGVLFGDGLRCVGMNVVRLEIVVPDANGNAQTSVPVGATGGVGAGDTKHYQYWYRDPLGSLCGSQFNLSNGWTIDWQ